MYRRNRTGPRTVPWGTPETTGSESDDAPSRRCHPSLARFSLARVSLTRASLARCILTRSQFGVFQFGAMPVWRVSLWRVSQFCVYVDPVDPVQYAIFSAKASSICAHVSISHT